MKIKILLFVLSFGASLNVVCQSTNKEPLWIQYMLEPNPNYYKVKNAFYDYWGDSIPERSNGYKVFKRWEWRVTRNMGPDGTVNWNEQQLKDLTAGSIPGTGNQQKGISGNNTVSPCPQLGRWTPVGPIRHPYNQTTQPTGIGRINGMAFHPSDSNTFFVCAPQGGVWKTTDNGSTWRQIFGVGPTVNTIGATSMVLSYNNPDTMYVGTGDRDAGDAGEFGVIASWNGGKTWVSRNTGMGNVSVGRMIMHPSNSKIILASTNGGIYRTTNGGASWTQTLSGSAWDIAFKPTDPSVVYAVIGARFYRSTDNGVNWTIISSGLPTSGIQRGMLAVTAADNAYVYLIISNTSSGFFGLYRSTNSGVDFSTMSTTPNILGYSATGSTSGGQGWYDLDIAADPFNRNVIYALGINVWKSTNGGSTWTINGHWVGDGGADDIHADQHSAEFNTTGRKLYVGNDGGIYFTSNGGNIWNNITTGIQNSQIYRLSQAQTNPFAGAQGYQDNGSSQTQQDEFYTYYGGDGMDCQTDPTDHNLMYGSYVFGRIYRSTDKNTNRTIANSGVNGVTETGAWLTPFILQEGNPSRMFAGYTNVWRSDDVKTSGAITFTSITSGFSGKVRQLENSPASNGVLYVINGSGHLLRSTNATAGTPTWTNLSGSQPSGLRYVESHYKNSNTLYGCTPYDLYKSTNQGTSWSYVASLPSNSGLLNCLFMDSSSKTERIYMGSEKGVFIWDSASNSVINFNNGFPVWADVTDLDIYHSPKGPAFSKLVASTYGMGVWRTNLYEDGTVKPKADYYAFDSIFVVGGKLRLYENVQNGASSLIWKITPYSYNYVDGTDSLSFNPVIVFTGKGLYTIQLIASNCQGNDTLKKNNWIRVYPKSTNATCKNTTNFQTVNYGIGIFRIVLTDNMSETGSYFDDGEYYDRSADKIFSVEPNKTYTAVIKTGPYNNEYVRLFFDYNNNGKFENYLNEVGSVVSTTLGTRNVSFTTPSNLKANTGIRMRVLSDFLSIDTNACRNLGYGQGEDYTLIYNNPIPYFMASKLSGCVNDTIVFTDTSTGLAVSYEWSFGAGASPSTATGRGPHSVKYLSSGLKDVRLRINGKDSLRKNNYIQINTTPAPVSVLKSGTLSGCENRDLVLAARVTNGVTFSVQWQKNGTNISGKTDTVLTLSNVKTADAGNYRARLINGTCTAYSSAVSVIVHPTPVPDYSVNNSPQCFRNNLFEFTNGSYVNTGTITQNKWYFGNGNSSTLKDPKYSYLSPGSYTVKLVVITNNGCSDSISKSVSVDPSAIVRFAVNDSDQCFSNHLFNFTNNSTISGGSLSYLWQFGDGNTSTATSPSKSYATSGIYNVRLISTSDKNCKDTFSKPVRVYAQPKAQYSINPAVQCLKGNKFTFTNSSTSTDGTLTYLWTFGDGKNSTLTSPVYSYTTDNSYSVKLYATSSFGCIDSNRQFLTVFPQGMLSFTVNDSDQCISGNSFVFNNTSQISSGTLNYLWHFGDNTTSTNKSPLKSYSSHGTFAVKLTSESNLNCRDTLNFSVRVYAKPQVDFDINTNSQCLKGNNFVFTNKSKVDDAGFKSHWDFKDGFTSALLNPSHAFAIHGIYGVKLIITSDFLCRDSLVKAVTVLPKARVSYIPNDSDQCLSGNQYVFANKSTVPSGNIDQTFWTFGDGNNSSLFSPTHSYTNYGIFPIRLIIISNGICRDTLNSQVRVYSQPKVSFDLSPGQVLCFKYNKFNALSTSIIPEGKLTSAWNFGDGSKTLLDTIQHSYAMHGNYVMKLVTISEYNCKDSISKNIDVLPSPVANFDASKNLICEKEIIQLTNKSTIPQGTIVNFWKLGSHDSSGQLHIQTQFDKYGFYNIALITTSDKNCLDTSMQTVEVASLPNTKFSVQPKNGCAGQTEFIFTAMSSNPDNRNLNHAWQFGDTATAVGNPIKHYYAKAGLFPVRLRSSSAVCYSDSIVNLLVSPAVNAKFSSVKLNAETRQYFAHDTTIPGYTYVWNFGDGQYALGKTTTHKYLENDTFNPRLIVYNDYNCRDTSDMYVQIASPNYKKQDNSLNFYVYPNPVNSSFTYKFVITEKRKIHVDLFDILGQTPLISKTWTDLEPGTYYETIDMNALKLSGGTYPFRIESDGDILVVKIIYVP